EDKEPEIMLEQSECFTGGRKPRQKQAYLKLLGVLCHTCLDWTEIIRIQKACLDISKIKIKSKNNPVLYAFLIEF
ncbi:MAG: hypothetical protein KBD78_15580, partial [Oligoflexales bacterium]|nr:hypothetical protein [Oligoflexales bacterium]